MTWLFTIAGFRQSIKEKTMRIWKLANAVVLIFIPLAGCAEDGSADKDITQVGLSRGDVHSTELQTELRDGGEIFTVGKDESGSIKASYFFTSPPTAKELSDRIIEMMKGMHINKEFIQKISTRLPRNRTLNKEEFSLPLTDIDGTVYRFNFISDIENRFFVINYISE